MVKNFEDVLNLAKSKEKKIVSVAAAHDKGVLKAVKGATEEGIIEPILLGNQKEIEKISKEIGFDLSGVKVIDIKDDVAIAREATSLVSSGEADILMKGLISTATILGQALDREIGLRGSGVISQVAVFNLKTYPKMLFLTDPAMNIAPNLEQKKEIIENAVLLADALHIEQPKVAALAAVENVNDRMEATIEARALQEACEKGEIPGCIVSGPLALDNAISPASAKLKGIPGEVAGEADILLVPDIEAGNILYKSLTFLAEADSAGIIMGTSAPIVLTSRADNYKAKFNSLALSVLLANLLAANLKK